MDLNTSLIFPLSGESFTCSPASVVTVTARETGIAYVLITTTSTTGSIAFGVNGTSNTISANFSSANRYNLFAGSSSISDANGAPSDRNNNPYIPVKKGDTLYLSCGNNTSGVISFLYFR